MAILTGPQIRAEIAAGRIQIDPFDPALVNQNSVDIRLGHQLRVYTQHVEGLFDEVSAEWSPRRGAMPLDVREDSPTTLITIPPEGFVLLPGIGYLASSLERVRTDHYVTILNGKSSLGRKFLKIHIVAGFAETGFDGNFTLELEVTHPLAIYAGQRIGQLVYNTVEGVIENYQDRGHYKGSTAAGPVASLSHVQAAEDARRTK